MSLEYLNKKIGKFDFWDVGLVKFCVLAATLGLVSGWELFQNWVIGIEWYWFVGAAILFGILPFKHFWFD